MNEFNSILTENDINQTMLKKYVGKHYKIYKIFLMDQKKLVSVKNPLKFEMFDYAQGKEVNTYLVFKLLVKIFSVDETLVRKVIRGMAIDVLNERDNY